MEQDMDNLLVRPYKHFVQESECANGCVQVLVNHLGMAKDKSNFGKLSLEFMGFAKFLKLDLAAINALMIFPKAGIQQLFASKNQAMTLVDYLDRCKTSMGQRCLKRWVKMPLQDPELINKRLQIVEFLVAN